MGDPTTPEWKRRFRIRGLIVALAFCRVRALVACIRSYGTRKLDRDNRVRSLSYWRGVIEPQLALERPH